jgi:hypothetical protein
MPDAQPTVSVRRESYATRRLRLFNHRPPRRVGGILQLGMPGFRRRRTARISGPVRRRRHDPDIFDVQSREPDGVCTPMNRCGAGIRGIRAPAVMHLAAAAWFKPYIPFPTYRADLVYPGKYWPVRPSPDRLGRPFRFEDRRRYRAMDCWQYRDQRHQQARRAWDDGLQGGCHPDPVFVWRAPGRPPDRAGDRGTVCVRDRDDVVRDPDCCSRCGDGCCLEWIASQLCVRHLSDDPAPVQSG